MKKKRKKRDVRSKLTKNEWVLCSEDWKDIVIMYVPQISDISMEDNYVDISQEEGKKAYCTGRD